MDGIAQRRAAAGRVFVLGCGVATTVVALVLARVLVWIDPDWHLMGWLYVYVVPVGALIIGLAAGSGYVIGAAFKGPLSKWMLPVVALVQVGAYLLFQWVEFRMMGLVYLDSGERVGFWEWYHMMATNIQFRGNEGVEAPLGMLGYGVRAVQVGGFAAAGVMLAAIPVGSDRDPCPYCGKAKKSKEVAVLPACEPGEALAPLDESDETGKQMADVWYAPVKELMAADAHGAVAEMLKEAKANRVDIEALPRKIRLYLVWCPQCQWNKLRGQLVRRLEGGYVEFDELEAVGVSPWMGELLRKG